MLLSPLHTLRRPAGTLNRSTGTPYRLVLAHFYHWYPQPIVGSSMQQIMHDTHQPTVQLLLHDKLVQKQILDCNLNSSQTNTFLLFIVQLSITFNDNELLVYVVLTFLDNGGLCSIISVVHTAVVAPAERDGV